MEKNNSFFENLPADFDVAGRTNQARLKEDRENSTPLIRISQVGKIYESPSGSFTALSDINFEIRKGEFVTIVGKSGSGKSTLMNVITGIDYPTSGNVAVAGEDIHSMNQRSLSLWRGRNIGVVFQFFQLLPTLTIAENIMLPMDFCNTFPGRERRDRAIALLERVGISEQADKLPSSLSGGQQQRAAIARALANNPPIIAADEPTGNLDSHTTEAILELFSGLTREGKTIIMVTHERDMTRYATREIALIDGSLHTDRTSHAQFPAQNEEAAYV